MILLESFLHLPKLLTLNGIHLVNYDYENNKLIINIEDNQNTLVICISKLSEKQFSADISGNGGNTIPKIIETLQTVTKELKIILYVNTDEFRLGN